MHSCKKKKRQEFKVLKVHLGAGGRAGGGKVVRTNLGTLGKQKSASFDNLSPPPPPICQLAHAASFLGTAGPKKKFKSFKEMPTLSFLF